MPQQVTLRNGHQEELAVVLANNMALRSLYTEDRAAYNLLVDFYKRKPVAIKGDDRKRIIDLHLVEMRGSSMQRKAIVSAIIESSVSGSTHNLEELPYDD